MILDLKGRVIDVKPGDDVNFVTLSDTVEGGTVKLMIPNTVDVKLDSLIHFKVIVKPSLGKFGLNLRFLRNVEEKGA